ncbi:hypothetical protein AVW11_04115 [Streptomyces amritsarensis]|uniref:Uncharacterized protein n=1 Tax=Streptomyces amritsarensis TaxID=681158 RepID=A0ABX3G8W8_9ACTN|nr:hypothetical protein [Streptomyces amritsarensis]OLZ72585.1 hypothetical protein AVW11_04115 [Streptomyces amritsarensis]
MSHVPTPAVEPPLPLAAESDIADHQLSGARPCPPASQVEPDKSVAANDTVELSPEPAETPTDATVDHQQQEPANKKPDARPRAKARKFLIWVAGLVLMAVVGGCSEAAATEGFDWLREWRTSHSR